MTGVIFSSFVNRSLGCCVEMMPESNSTTRLLVVYCASIDRVLAEFNYMITVVT